MHGSKAFSLAFLSAIALPHKLRGPVGDGCLASYQYIVTERFGDLRQKCWYPPASRLENGVRCQTRRLPEHVYTGLSHEINRRARRKNPHRRHV